MRPGARGDMAIDAGIHLLEKRLAGHRPVSLPGKSRITRACTCILLNGSGDDMDLLLIRRARRKGDPWSGHVGLPGGKMASGDGSGRSAAVRELMEETGINVLSGGRYLGRLSDLLTRSHNNRRPMMVTPYVFHAQTNGTTPEIQEDEVADIFTLPLSFLLDNGNRRSFSYPLRGRHVRLPCYVFEGRRIWGLTLMMLNELAGVYRGRHQGYLTWARRYLGFH